MKKKEKRLGADGGNTTKKRYGKFGLFSLLAQRKNGTISKSEFKRRWILIKGQAEK